MHMLQYVSISQERSNPATVCVCIITKLPITSDAAAYISPLLEQTTVVTKIKIKLNFKIKLIFNFTNVLLFSFLKPIIVPA